MSLSSKYTLTPLLLLLLNGCNGGGGNDASEPQTVNNHLPIAIAGINQHVKLSEKVVHLDGTGSVDYDQDSITFSWEMVSKPFKSKAELINPESRTPRFEPDLLGTYLVELVVNDGKTDSRPNQVKIEVIRKDENTPPTIKFSEDKYTSNLTRQIYLVTRSQDIDGDKLSFTWEVLSHPQGSNYSIAKSTTHSSTTLEADTEGDYVVKVTAFDGFSEASATTTASFSYENVPPHAEIDGQAFWALDNMSVPLNGTTSGDANGDSLTYKWHFTKKPNGSSAVIDEPYAVQTSFLPDIPGDYVVNLTVNDGEFSDSHPYGVRVKAISESQPHTKLTRGSDTTPLLLPHEQNNVIDKTSDTSPIPNYYTLDSYTFEAVGKPITITLGKYSLNDKNNVVTPRILVGSQSYDSKDLRDRGVVIIIPVGDNLTFQLQSPPTNGKVAKASMSFSWSLNGPNNFSMVENIDTTIEFTSR
ncbi:PKD domain-containing protein [Vibrio sp. VNB-15]